MSHPFRMMMVLWRKLLVLRRPLVGDKSSIEWTEATWNPTTGCDRTSPGCDHCYAMTLAKRLKAMGLEKYQRDGNPKTSGPGFGLTIHPAALDIPRTWRTPRTIFVNSMSDLFHKDVPLSFIRDVFDVMRETPQHTYQVLTKRSKRLAQLGDQLDWPVNTWMGVSVETAAYRFRIRHLAEVPAAVRFLSCEPLIDDLGDLPLDGIHWVIAGGESGPRARPSNPDWFRSLRAQCVAEGIPLFFKQWGEHGEDMLKVGRRKAGAMLDGRAHRAAPVQSAGITSFENSSTERFDSSNDKSPKASLHRQ
ncbi:MAG: hypothetical protein JWM05_2688 [Acidimicrobiales bacterium]|nr:hypothetical protein [Acidimicrobiales bacterium]